jgi:MFS transporter, ACS family, D-galactonate transporter
LSRSAASTQHITRGGGDGPAEAVVGAAGIVFGLIWWRSYREPYESTSVNQPELDHIAAGGGIVTTKAANTRFKWQLVGKLLRFRQLVGICIGQFAGNSTLVSFLTWFPTYLIVGDIRRIEIA